MTDAAIIELGYLAFEVSDLPRWEHFAGEVLGLSVRHGPNTSAGKATRLLRMDDAAHRFILVEGGADDYAFAGWRVADAGEVEAFGTRLTQHGVQWTRGTDAELALRGVEIMLHFLDPAGNRHEIYCGTAHADTPFVSARVPSGFVTGAGGLGHVVYEVENYPAMADFVQSVMGLRLSDHIDMAVAPGVSVEIAFFHINERHHSFAVAPRPPVPGPHKRIHHFMLEAREMSDVGLARDRCLMAGQPVIMDIGQHPNDQMISFYGQTPSGFNVEFGFGGVLVDDANWQTTRYDHISDWGHRPAQPLAMHGAQAAATEDK
ncbi:VOC family protein [Cupriavidus sp. CV2]|uniref:VOC family protein n=1 Tax=Cupriavidus ulmosensis TaxID=3065913 RepID=UPI00296A9C69|nr:VOC family protein [Cupriavidus sp. CV2]MDW3688239.1 VOC family protein [Cupriavidus sp. CV2]